MLCEYPNIAQITQEVLPDLYRQIIDVMGTVGADQDDPHLPYDVRIVGVRHEDD